MINRLIQDIKPEQVLVAGPKTSLETLRSNQALANQNTKYLTVAATGYLETG